MTCPKCGAKTLVLETREKMDGEKYIYRRRECTECGYRLVSGEYFLRGLPSRKKEVTKDA